MDNRDKRDMVIAVMGSTGTGKSSFVKLITGDSSIKIGQSLESETSDVRVYRFRDQTRGRNVVIVDTPGFDDSRSGVTDTEILKKITNFLLEEYDKDRKLTGLIYLTRISDPRFGGQSKRNLRMFKNLCGSKTFKNIVILTTFWDMLATDKEGIAREDELKYRFFQDLVDGGASFMRHDRTIDSAQRVLERVLAFDPTAVQIQEEIRIQGKALEDTSAGSVHREEVERIIAKHRQEVQELKAEIGNIRNDNSALRKELEEEQERLRKKLAQWEKEKQELEKGLDEQKQGRKRLEQDAARQKENRERWQSEQKKILSQRLEQQAKAHREAMQRIQEELEEVKKARRVEERASPPPPYEANYSVINPLNGIFKDEYQFTHTERYPPYLRSIPAKEKKGVLDIFDFTSFVETTVVLFCGADLVASLRALAPSWSTAASMQELVSRNQGLHMRSRQEGRPGGIPLRVDDRPTDMYFSKNVGLRDDWYTDEVFGQQQFTGTNPTTIKIAPRKWIESFKKAANIQRRADVMKVLNEDAGNIFVQDYSDFRQFMGMPSRAELKNGDRHGCAAVALFRLEAEGKLHPLAIVLDYKGSMEASVTIFNQRINSNMTRDQERDWPWRYAKMCVQVSDWMRHEVAIHLVNTHLVEEVIIVAAHRTLNSSHIVFQLLEPHWATTLPLNKAARETLVPKIINRMTGCTADQTYRFLNASFDDFDWTGLYIPNDLKKRGFPTTVEELDGLKYHNYGYARNILRMWQILRSFVTTVLKGAYPGGDGQVAGDLALDALCQEVRSFNGGRLSSFPASLKTLDDLIDFVTMCIHIASPQHTAVNYLQQYYQTFVPNKPSALYKQLPRSLDELNEFEEVDLLLALPLHQPKDWLLMAQVPYLLSFEVPDESTILFYAMATSDHKARQRGVPEIIKNAAQKLKDDLESFIPVVEENSRQLDDQKTPYLVLDPSKTAISILI